MPDLQRETEERGRIAKPSLLGMPSIEDLGAARGDRLKWSFKASPADPVSGNLEPPIQPPAPKRPWYDFMEGWVPYKDLILVLGASFIIGGIGLISLPASLIAAGLFLLKLAMMMAKV